MLVFTKKLLVNFALSFIKINVNDPEILIPVENRPHSINGYFYHNHKNDKKYHRHPDGGWKKQGSHADPNKRKRCPPLPRVRNGKIFPISARKTHTIDEILARNIIARKKKNAKESKIRSYKKDEKITYIIS